MDRNQTIGFALLMLLFLGWMWTSAPTAEEMERRKFVQDSIEQAKLATEEFRGTKSLDQLEAIEETNSISPDDTLATAKLNQQYGDFGSMMVGEESKTKLSNDLMTLTFSTKGGRLLTAELNDHKKVILDADKNEIKSPLIIGNDAGKFEYILTSKKGEQISTADLIFKAQKIDNGISFIASSPGGSKIEQRYKLDNGKYALDYQLRIDGAKQLLSPANNSIRLKWHEYLNKIELNQTFEKFYSTVYFKEKGENSDYCNCRSDDTEDDPDMNIEWISHSNQFFNKSLVPQGEHLSNTFFETKMMDEDHEYMKLTKSEGDLALRGDNTEIFNFKMYVGPNEFERLQLFENDLEQVVPFGTSIFGTINRYIIRPSFNFLSKYIGSKGVVIIILIFILKMLLYPFMYKMLYSQAKMGALKPKLAHLKDKYKDDAQKIQMETMKIYREYGVSPLGGCLPMIAQMPIWYALFRFFPASITFRQEPFLWATDLSSFDVISWLPFEIPMFGAHISLFTVLWAISTVAYTYYNTKHMDMSANPAMKYVQYAMPVMFLVFFNNYASGLTCYMFFSNLFNIMQTVITKKFVFDEEKIKAELEVEKAKPKKKKGNFQARLEEAMKQQQELQKKNAKKKK